MSDTAPLLSTLENYLKLTTVRERTLSGNMANVDTPGYHTRDINFQAELHRAVFTTGADGEPTAQLSPVAGEVSGLMERADGNNVDLDRESLLMAETQLQYQMGIQLIKRQFHEMLSAINGGN